MLRHVGVSVLLDRALGATVAAKGLYFRADNFLEDLLNDDLLVDSCNVRQRCIFFFARDFFCFMGATCRKKLALRPEIKAAVFLVGLDAAKQLYYQA